MKFQKGFKRYVGEAFEKASEKMLGADVDPRKAEAGHEASQLVTNDHVIETRMTSINGWPVQRICVGYRGPGPSVIGRAFMYDDDEKVWYRVGKDVEIEADALGWFDCPVIIDLIQNGGRLHANAGIQIALVFDKHEDAPDGEYSFRVGSDLSSSL